MPLKVREDIRKLTTSQSNLSRALGLTQPRINQLIDEGIVIRDEQDTTGGVMIFESLKNFFVTKARDDETPDYWVEKARHEEVKRKLAELKIAKIEGKLYDATTVELVLIELYTTFRTQLSGLPSKLATRLEGKSREKISEILTVEIETLLQELTQLDPDEFRAEFELSDGET